MQSGNVIQLSCFPEEVQSPQRAASTYFIIISPPSWLKEKVKLSVTAANSIIPLSVVNLGNLAHISLFKFLYKDDDADVIGRVNNAVFHFPSFPVKLNGVDIFRHGAKARTLYAALENPYPVKIIQQLIVSRFRLKPGHFTPHLTILRNIPVSIFDKIADLSFDFDDEFECDHITILKKLPGEKKFKVLTQVALEKIPDYQ
ncbi:2'-5' RNA ligase family protein [Chitinophaga vietnamensis]|uniref:2'-5' RNA ligase family protein n=1 Tax=Chitinophaga vietnamensis TaxID=2593957 RepID=UPI0011774DDB|nr:2'-5' RNA ligase family protein [Chitinophaga vietnamensis]